MAPSFLFCVLLTVAASGAAVAAVEDRTLGQWAILGIGGAVWLVQLWRWGMRFFGYNYRLTTRRLFRDQGFRYRDRVQAELADVVRVSVDQNLLERLLDVARVTLVLAGPNRPPLVLRGVRKAEEVAALIRKHCPNLQGGG
jgi:hypothetical protein